MAKSFQSLAFLISLLIFSILVTLNKNLNVFSSTTTTSSSASCLFVSTTISIHHSRSLYHLVNLPFHSCCSPSVTKSPLTLSCLHSLVQYLLLWMANRTYLPFLDLCKHAAVFIALITGHTEWKIKYILWNISYHSQSLLLHSSFLCIVKWWYNYSYLFTISSCLERLTQEVPRRDLSQMPEPFQLFPFVWRSIGCSLRDSWIAELITLSLISTTGIFNLLSVNTQSLWAQVRVGT